MRGFETCWLRTHLLKSDDGVAEQRNRYANRDRAN
jgi:hypothetical protein